MVLLCGASFAAPPDRLIPEELVLNPSLRAAVDDTVLTEVERNELRTFHGLFDELPEAFQDSPAVWAARGAWDHGSLNDDDTAPLLRATAALHRGEHQIVVDLLEGNDDLRAIGLRAQAMVGLGRRDQALQDLNAASGRLLDHRIDDAAQLTSAAESLALRAVLEGRPARDFQLAIDLMIRAHQQIDRHYWPALVAQARLLIDKDNRPVAAEALHEALALNPNAIEAWDMLGRIALRSFDFESTTQIIDRLREIHATSVSADVLEAHMLLTLKDPAGANDVIDRGLERFPMHRELLSCRAAAAALSQDDASTRRALDAFDALSPDHPLALYQVGRYLAFAREYDRGAQYLRLAISRDTYWPAPHIELAMLLSQDGRDAEALDVLGKVTALDPFNRRAANTLVLFEELSNYETLETEHFIIRYRKGIDEALARDMPDRLEQMYAEVTAFYDHRPQRKTHIEIMPDRRWFAVRITGMPWIWTIGACTGPVVAITPPRHGAHHAGPFDWPRVIRHEFAHTVTLDKTRYRIPHWFTEACSVTQELAPRPYQECQQLSAALEEDELFDLEEINWAFVRPLKPTDRPLAYAQARWMYEYIAYKHGHAAILKMLDLCRAGVAQGELVPRATGQSAEQFLAGFKAWAAEQVDEWGLSPDPPSDWVVAQVKGAGDGVPGHVSALLVEHPDHPDLLRIAAGQAMAALDFEAAEPLLERYAAARPVDPWADRQLAELIIARGQAGQAVGLLEHLDRVNEYDNSAARMLTRVLRQGRRLGEAQTAAQRQLDREPYAPSARELAATIALQNGDAATAERHLVALTITEPSRAHHFVRLAAFYTKFDRPAAADAAARHARELDPKSPVEPFLSPDDPTRIEQ